MLAYVCLGDHGGTRRAHAAAIHCDCGAGYFVHCLRTYNACPNCGEPWGSDDAVDAVRASFKLATAGPAWTDRDLVLNAARMLDPDVPIWTPKSDVHRILAAAYKARRLKARRSGLDGASSDAPTRRGVHADRQPR